MDLLTFNEALKEATSKKHLLLGNGFSISWNRDIFNYRSLKNNAKGLPDDILKLFDILNTADFEEVITAYEYASKVCDVYKIENKFQAKANKVREILIESIAQNHPDLPSKVTNDEFENCVNFLSNFDSIYTLNYDMLLYWVTMRGKFREDDSSVKLTKISDGFAYNDKEFLNWDGNNFETHYLHGALHIFETDELLKLNYKETSIPLKNQFITLIKEKNKLPLFVAEGSSYKKLTKIRNSGYLTRCLNSLNKIGTMKSPHSVFSFGVSFSENDNHIIDCLAKNKCHNFYVSLYGDPKSKINKETIKRANKIVSIRNSLKKKAPITLKFFSAESAKVWR